MKKNYAHLNPDDRDRIAVMYNKGTSISDIARELGRNKGTISREIDRNSSLEYNCYLGNRAQQRAGLRAKNSHHHHRLRNEDVRAYVLSHLEIGWSPEQISGRIGIDHPGWSISHESIYQYIYDSGTPDRKHLIECLRHSHRIRKPKIIGRGITRRRFQTEFPLTSDQRVSQLDKNSAIGKTDSLISRKSSTTLNSTCERKTKLKFLTKMSKKTAEETSAAIINRLHDRH